MKPIKFKKLRFHKETIADLHSKEMTAAHGGQEDNFSNLCPAHTYTECRTQCPSGGVPCAYC